MKKTKVKDRCIKWTVDPEVRKNAVKQYKKKIAARKRKTGELEHPPVEKDTRRVVFVRLAPDEVLSTMPPPVDMFKLDLPLFSVGDQHFRLTTVVKAKGRYRKIAIAKAEALAEFIKELVHGQYGG